MKRFAFALCESSFETSFVSRAFTSTLTTHPHSQCHRFIYTTTFTQMHIHHYFLKPELNTNGDYTIDTTPLPLYLPLYEYYTTHHCNFLVSLSISLIRQTAILKYITNSTTLSRMVSTPRITHLYWKGSGIYPSSASSYSSLRSRAGCRVWNTQQTTSRLRQLIFTTMTFWTVSFLRALLPLQYTNKTCHRRPLCFTKYFSRLYNFKISVKCNFL